MLFRSVFFCKGAIETVRKFGWSPDIIHCHGWMTALIPMYIRAAYKNDPLFQPSKVIYSLYDSLTQPFNFDEFAAKASINNLSIEDMVAFRADENVDMHKGATAYSDAIVKVNEVSAEISQMLAESDKPVLGATDEEGLKPYYEFYNSLEAEVVG